MSWQRNYVTLPTGERVRYSLLKRPESNVYFARFKPNGGRAERSTGCLKNVDAVSAAHRINLEEFGQVATATETVAWDVARERLEESLLADGKRLRTIKEYLKSLKRLPEMFPTRGAGDMTERMASDFKTKYAAGRTIRKKKLKPGEKAKARIQPLPGIV